MTKVIEIETSEKFKEEIKSGVTLVDFFAIWCGPCQAMKPILEAYAAAEPGVKVLAVDVDQLADVASEYQVMSIPTFVLFKDGEAVDVKMGRMSEDDLKDWVNSKK